MSEVQDWVIPYSRSLVEEVFEGCKMSESQGRTIPYSRSLGTEEVVMKALVTVAEELIRDGRVRPTPLILLDIAREIRKEMENLGK